MLFNKNCLKIYTLTGVFAANSKLSSTEHSFFDVSVIVTSSVTHSIGNNMSLNAHQFVWEFIQSLARVTLKNTSINIFHEFVCATYNVSLYINNIISYFRLALFDFRRTFSLEPLGFFHFPFSFLKISLGKFLANI